MGVGERVVQLACHETHQFHEACYNNFVEHFERNDVPLNCPICRAVVDKTRVIKKEIAAGDQNFGDTLKVDDAFALAAGQAESAVGDKSLPPKEPISLSKYETDVPNKDWKTKNTHESNFKIFKKARFEGAHDIVY